MPRVDFDRFEVLTFDCYGTLSTGMMTHDRWSGADDYEWYIGRWSRLVAAEFIDWIDAAPGLDWVDVGCGTGNLSARIVDVASPASVVGIDPSADFLRAASQRVQRDGVRFAVGSADALPVPDDSADAVVAGLVLNFVPDAAAACREAARVARSGGTVAAYVWDYARGMEPLRFFFDAATAVDPAAAEVDEGPRFPIARSEALERLWNDSGFTAVEARAIDVPTHFRDFDDYWGPFLTGVGVAPAYTVKLDPVAQDRLRDRLRQTLPIDPDGSIRLTARAWAVRGNR